MSGLSIPALADGVSCGEAAIAYVQAGWAVGPVLPGTKNPGSVLKAGWPGRTIRDVPTAAATWAGTNYGVFLHMGRSGPNGCVAVDVDHEADVPPDLLAIVQTLPWQGTRDDDPGRRHYFSQMPHGRTFGNSEGRLRNCGLNIRGVNGVVLAEPSVHPEPHGRYRLGPAVPVPTMPPELVALMPDHVPSTEDAASTAAVAAFFVDHATGVQPGSAKGPIRSFETRVNAGGSRHEAAKDSLIQAMKEAHAGLYAAEPVHDELRYLFVDAMAHPTTPGSRITGRKEAQAEFDALVSWAVAQATTSDVAKVIAIARRGRPLPPDGARWRPEPQPEPRQDPPGDGSESQGGAPPRVPAHGTVIRLSDVEPEKVSWLWPGRIAVGKVVNLTGDPSMGKSTLAIDFSARISTGAAWPDGSPCPLGNVLILSAEDGLADTVRPRLDAAHGDPSRVHALTEVVDGSGETRPVTLADVDIIEAAVKSLSIVFIVVDVLMAYLPSGVDSHRDPDMRKVLARLSKMAERTKATVLFLRHMNKSPGGSAMYRGGGSIAIIGAARAEYLVAPDPDAEPGTRVFASNKNNLAPDAPSLKYRLDGTPNGAAHVVWLGVSPHGADALLNDVGDDEDRSERSACEAWLRNFLGDKTHGGAAPAAAVRTAARLAGFGDKSLRTARERICDKPEKSSMGGGWIWVLKATHPKPTQDAPGDDEPAHTQGRASSAPSGLPRAPSQPTLDSTVIGAPSGETPEDAPEGAEDAHPQDRAHSDPQLPLGELLDEDPAWDARLRDDPADRDDEPDDFDDDLGGPA